jgi:hypothetical protein
MYGKIARRRKPGSWRTPTIANRSGENIVIEQGKVARNIKYYVNNLTGSTIEGKSIYYQDNISGLKDIE